MSAKGNTLTNWTWLNVGDYLVANNGFYFAIMQGDGNFCVYRGSAPDNNCGLLWGSVQAAGYHPQDGNYFAIMQNDGNFCGYRGTGPSDNQGFLWSTAELGGYQTDDSPHQYTAVLEDDGNFCVYKDGVQLWCTGKADPIVQYGDDVTITYDLASTKLLQAIPQAIWTDTLINNTGTPQNNEVDFSTALNEQHSWSTSHSTTMGMTVTIQCSIPVVGAGGSVALSASQTNSYTTSGQQSTTDTWSFKGPVATPPYTTIKAVYSVTVSTISVPYTAAGTFITQSGQSVKGSITGTFTGSSSHDLNAAYTQVNPATGAVIQTNTVPVAATVG